MRRYAIWALAALVLGGSTYIAWARTKQRAAARVTPEETAVKPFQPSEDRAQALVEELNNEFFKHSAVKPSAAAREKIRELTGLGQKSNDAALLLEQWLMQVHLGEEAGSEEFAEMAQALLAVEVDAPRRVVKKHHFAQDDRERQFAELQLIAFGKAALPALLEGIKDEAGNQGFVKFPGKSGLPVVLARLGPEAVPDVAGALQNNSPYVRHQAVRALRIMGVAVAGPALPDLLQVLDDPGRSETHLAVVGLLGEFGPRARPALPALRRLAGEARASELREAARALLAKIDSGKDQ
jgi:HEAT repeat protein